MSKQGVILAIIVVVLIMFAPILLADGIAKFFHGLGVMFSEWTS